MSSRSTVPSAERLEGAGAGFSRASFSARARLTSSFHSITPRDWQGIVEWNELVKRARAEKEAREKPAPAPSSRSAEGTVEMLDMLKNAAKAKKDGAGVQ